MQSAAARAPIFTNSRSKVGGTCVMSTKSDDGLGSGRRTPPNLLGEAADILRELAEPWPVGSYTKEAIDRAAKRAGFSYSRAFDVWYGKARRIEQFERDALIDARDKKRREVARNELHEIKKRVAILEARLAQTDSEFHRETIDALGFAGGAWQRPSPRRG